MPYSGMLIRAAKIQDAMGVARVDVRSWQAAYRGILPAEFLDALKPEDRASRYTFENPDVTKPLTIVAEDDGVITGFATTGPARDADAEGCGELFALYVDPDCWDRGMGVELIKAARGRLVEYGFQDAILWVMKGNSRAECFYTIDGWQPDGLERSQTLWGVTVNELRYRRGL
jgi:GNAT superfamily N-acetyltransferase